jgi:hypothetical protein
MKRFYIRFIKIYNPKEFRLSPFRYCLLSIWQNIAGAPFSGPTGGDTVTLLEISQYSFETGSSACTPIACSIVAIILGSFDNKGPVVDAPFLTEAVISGVMSYTQLVKEVGSVDHLSVAEYFNQSEVTKAKLSQVGEPIQGLLTNRDAFLNLIKSARESVAYDHANRGKHIGIVITKPPETVCITIPPLDSNQSNNTYSFFDSHPRPECGISQACYVTSNDIDSIILRLNAIFPANVGIESDGYEGSYMQMIYSTFEGTVFLRK